MANYYQAITRIDFDTSTLTGNYQLITADGLSHSAIFLILTNDSNNDIDISYDGVTDHDIILGNSEKYLPKTQQDTPNFAQGGWRKAQEIWVKSATANAGTLYVAGYYL